MDSPQVPTDGSAYVATPVLDRNNNPILHVVPLGNGRQEFGFLATVEGFGNTLWFIVVMDNDQRRVVLMEKKVKVRFRASLYFNHDEPPRGELHPDARFVVEGSTFD